MTCPAPAATVAAGFRRSGSAAALFADIDLLLTTGITPKNAWINPAGGHMGRDTHGWRDPVIFAKVTAPWFRRLLEQPS